MITQRLSPNQILTSIPLETAREATWQAFAKKSLANPIIDVQRNVVAGSTGMTIGSYGQTVTDQVRAALLVMSSL